MYARTLTLSILNLLLAIIVTARNILAHTEWLMIGRTALEKSESSFSSLPRLLDLLSYKVSLPCQWNH